MLREGQPVPGKFFVCEASGELSSEPGSLGWLLPVPLLLFCFCSGLFSVLLSDIVVIKELRRSQATRGTKRGGQRT